MTATAFIAAVFLLLMTPGPTNTLLAVAGASAGFRRSMPLIVAEAGGYLLTVAPLATFAGPYLATHPVAAAAIKLCSAIWVLMLAVKLWTVPANLSRPQVTFTHVFVTTVLNPKALIFGLVLMPHGSIASVLPWLGLLAGSIMIAACIWLGCGAVLVRRPDGEFPPLLRRTAACLLLFFSAGLAGSSLGFV